MLNDTFKKYIYIVFLVLVFFYISYHLVVFFSAPKLIIDDFKNNKILVVKKEEYTLKGKALKVKKILINDKEIFLDIDKNFSEKLYLYPKENQYIIEYFLNNGKSFKSQIGLYRE